LFPHPIRIPEPVGQSADVLASAEPAGNNPQDYVRATRRSQALLEIICDLPTDARILEVGCNAGRNLAYLFDHGYTGVEGVEINPYAVDLLRSTFPQLADREIRAGLGRDRGTRAAAASREEQ
jgi:hypothetical protein